MGKVYRARDTRLGREVAVKVSAERFSARFEREARAIQQPAMDIWAGEDSTATLHAELSLRK